MTECINRATGLVSEYVLLIEPDTASPLDTQFSTVFPYERLKSLLNLTGCYYFLVLLD